MFKSLQTRLKRASRWLPVALLPFAAHAQFTYTVANTTNVAGTYTDLGTAGTVIATSNTDDANSAATPIGFTFNYNGTAFNDFILNTNGFIKLGTTAPSSAALFFASASDPTIGGPTNSTNPADTNILMPFNTDLESGTSTAEYRVATTGTTGSRVTTIQWKNVSDKVMPASGKQYANFQFQVRLYEGSNLIEFVYGTAVAGPGPDAFKYLGVAIKGSSNTAADLITMVKGSTQAWSATTPVAGPYLTTTNAHNIRSTVLPDAGRTYRFAPVVANDGMVSAVYTLTKLPIPQGVPHAVRALITNNGTAPISNLTVTLNVTGANTFNNTQSITSLAVGASTTVTFAPYVPTIVGTNNVTVTIPADGNNSNNTATVSQAVNTSTYSYADASAPTSARGFGPSTTAVSSFDVKYTANTSVSITQVRALLVDFVGAGMAGSTIGKTVYAVVLNPTTGAVLGRSPDYVIAAADVTGTTYTTFTLSTPVAAPAGDFLVGLAQTYQAGQTTQYFPIATQPELPTARTGAYYTASISTPAAPTDVTTLGTAASPSNYRFMIEAVTTSTSAPACTPVSNVTAGSITQTGASISFTAPAGTSGYTVTYTPTGGTATTVTPAPTGSPFTLSGLSSGTTYTVSIVASCSAGANSIPVTTTFTTLVPAPTYATIPYTQDFENWINVAGTKDVPSNNWRNTPPTGNNSWRRDDEGFTTAGWFYASAETSSNPPYRIRFSTGAHSARFHTYGANNGEQGKLDLYVDLSGTGTKVLSFDYINPTGLDKLEVFLSTDGGATFGSTALLTATTSAAFTARTVVVPSTSATSVLRFQATADNLGDDDIGLDNLRLALGSAAREQALAAGVSLFPNPAHQRVSLSVPAGPLTSATATLRNTLGQVVFTRALGLPTAGGTTAFEVNQLAPGLYSLTLQAGETLVVKQLVIE